MTDAEKKVEIKKEETTSEKVETVVKEEKKEESKKHKDGDASKKEEPKEVAEKNTEAVNKDIEEVDVPAKFKDLVEMVENMSVIELHELVKLLEKKFGVSAAAVAVAGNAGGESESEEKDSFDVELTSVGDKKIAVIKAIKEVLGLGLKEAKDFVDGAPNVLKEGMNKAEAEEFKSKIDAAGGQATLK